MEKIAIIGLSCLFPGSETPEQYWQNLLAQKKTTSKATAEQMGVAAELFYAPNKGTQDKYYCIQGGYIRDFTFDPHGYHLPADYIDSLDDLFKWPLYVSKEAIKDSGYHNNQATLNRCGVVFGNLSFPTKSSHHLLAPMYKQALEPPVQNLLKEQPFALKGLAAPASGAASNKLAVQNLMTFGYPAAFVSQALALGGVNFALDAACASSLYAVKLASQYLLTGKADLMLAGAVSRADPFFINMGFSIFQAYPENGLSNPLNKASDGLFAGEGAGVFVLKRHNDAVRAGDKIYAVINGVGLSNDGKGKFLLQPNPKGQILAFERAYAKAQVDPTSIDYVECHATGTPVGDKTELNTMDAFFGQYQAKPLIGSVKSNLGHLLTAAGMAGMSKVILGMAHQQIPATINLSDPLSSKNDVISTDQLVKSTIPWPQRSETKRAAVSAFGFGGANAHLILEEYHQSSQPDVDSSQVEQVSAPQQKMAIVGMDAFFGQCNGLDSFGQAIYDGTQLFTPVPEGRWHGIESQPEILKQYGFVNGEAPHGAYITDFDMDFLHFKIPPNDDQPIPQQLLILNVADRALQDAGLKEGGNVAVIIGTGTELSLHRFRGRVDLSWQIKESLAQSGISLTPAQTAELEAIAKDSIHQPAEVNQYTSFIGNIMASRISAQWDFSGPTFTISAEENSTFKALEVAQMFLAAGEVDAVVVGAVDLAGGVENVLLRNQIHPVNTGPNTLSIDEQANGWLIGEGAGVVVLKRHEDAVEAQDRIYAAIDAVSVVQGQPPDDTQLLTPLASGVTQACQQAFANMAITPAEVGYLELFGSGITLEDNAEIQGITAAYQTETGELSCALGSVKANIGHTYAASGIASLIKTAHCLYYRYIPATPHWSGPKQAEIWQNSPFYVAPQSSPWFVQSSPWFVQSKDWTVEPHINKRVAAINGLGADGAYAHLILSDEPRQPVSDNRYLSQSSFHLWPVAANNQAEMMTQLSQLQEAISQTDSLVALARQSFEVYQQQSQAPYVLTLVGHSKAELQKEIKIALKTMGQAFESGQIWKTPLGSYFTPQPLGQQGKVTFVYPGAFSAYPGLGQDLFHLFPQLHHTFAAQVADPGQLVAAKALYPRSLPRLSEKELKRHTFRFMSNSIAMLQAGATYSTVVTQILQEQFKLQPQTALGYSLGEMTMMYALGIWAVGDNNSEALQVSPLFRERLSGPQNAVREFWGQPPVQVADKKMPLWGIVVLKAPADTVKQVVEATERVYLTHINTPQEVVIGGDPLACQQVVAQLQCDYVPVPYSHVIHCEPMRSEYNEFVKLNTLPISNMPDTDFYFAADEAFETLNSDTIARNIATATCHMVNFPQLIERAYDDGARIFVELGPRSACTWWIADILKDKAHLSVAIDRRSTDDQTALVKLLAQLTSHRVPLDLSALYQALPSEAGQAQPQRALVRTVSLIDTPIRDAILTDKNRQTFSDIPVKSVKPLAQPNASPVAAPPATVVTAQAVSTTGGASVETVTQVKSVGPQQNIPQQAGPNSQDSGLESPGDNLIKDPLKQPIAVEKMVKNTVMNEQVINPEAKAHQPEPEIIEKSNGSSFFDQQLQQLSQNTQKVNQAHATFLRTRQEGLRQITQLAQLQQQVEPTQAAPQPATTEPDEPREISRVISKEAQNRPNNYSQPENIIWDEADLIAYAGGDIAPIFGAEYAIIDTYGRRVRLPMLPYLLVSRITKLQGQRNVYEPSTMTTEYDIPFESWYTTDGQIPWAVAVESGQCDLMLISYLGIDFQNKGERVYRLLDCTLTFLEEMPLEGHTLRYDISIDSFAKNGDSLLFFFSYNCFVGDTMVLKMRGGCAGFFSDEELAGGKGIITTEKERQAKLSIPKSHFEPLLQCTKTSFTSQDMVNLSRGNIAACFGDHYAQPGLNPSLCLPPEGILMIDRITTVDPTGGAWGLGLLVTEKDLEPDHWYFPCHFKDDEVMAGSLVAEGCSQMLQFYLLYLGFQTTTIDARFQPVFDLPQVVRTRKQIMACSSKLIYRMEITEIGLSPHPYAKANVDIIFEGRVVVDFKNLGLQLIEKNPNDPYAMTQSAVSSVVPTSTPIALPTPPAAIEAFSPRPALYNESHIQEFAMGSISKCFGPDYEVFEGRRIPRTPNGDLMLFSRIVEINAERFVFSGQPNLVSEYDVPADPWFCRKNSYATTPYSVLMEIALQPCGFLSAYLGSTLSHPEEDFYFRNLDGDGHLLRNIDVRGKTIVNRVKLLSSTAIQGIIIQKFEYEMSCNDEVFYSGMAVFGYFQPQSLANQVGLDQGKDVRPWYEQEDVSALAVKTIDLRSSEAQSLYQTKAEKPFYRLALGQLNFLDDALVIPDGGRHGQGYVYASKIINPQDWFFFCHFYQDPVMPGSLGVEAILQALQLYVLEQDLAAHLQSPYFSQAEYHKVVWMYRGQIIPDNHKMYLEIDISSVEAGPDKVTIVGQASLWKDNMRIYQVKDIALSVLEARLED